MIRTTRSTCLIVFGMNPSDAAARPPMARIQMTSAMTAATRDVLAFTVKPNDL